MRARDERRAGARYACLWVPAFLTATAERDEPGLARAPLVIVDGALQTLSSATSRAVSSGTSQAARVVDANAEARARGVRPAMPLTEARARCATLVVRPRSRTRADAARQALLGAAFGVSPRVEDAAPGRVHIELDGLARLFGDDWAIGGRLVREARAAGFGTAVSGIAGSRTAAWLAASSGQRVRVVPPGAERETLAEAPLELLGLDEDLRATLGRWGIATLGELAALPRSGLAERLGPSGLRAHALALGLDPEPFRAWTPRESWEESAEFGWELDTAGSLQAALGAPVGRLLARLERARFLADELAVELALARGGRHALELRLASPLADAPPILGLIALALEREPPPGPVTGLTVRAVATSRRALPLELGRPPGPAARDFATLLARLTALVGPDNVGAPAVCDSHRPDPAALVPLAFESERRRSSTTVSSAASRVALAPGAVPGPRGPQADGLRGPQADGRIAGDATLALRRARPPRALDVGAQAGRPVAVDWPSAWGPRRPGAAGVRVVAAVGPWQRAGGWWDRDAWALEEWDVELTSGLLCRLTHDELTGRWYLDGVYD